MKGLPSDVLIILTIVCILGVGGYMLCIPTESASDPIPQVEMIPMTPCECTDSKETEVIAQELFWALETAIQIWEDDEVVWGDIADAPTKEMVELSNAIYELEGKVHAVWAKYQRMYRGQEKWRKK